MSRYNIPILDMIDEFNKTHWPACVLAHNVLEDYNLGDGHILWYLNGQIDENLRDGTFFEEEYRYDPEYGNEQVQDVRDFLQELLTIPEEKRIAAMDQYFEATWK